MKTQKRFKTKQEYKRDNDMLHFLDNVRILETKPSKLYGMPCKKWQLSYSERLVTTDPHPFDSMDIKAWVTPKQSEKLVKKAEKMGYEKPCAGLDHVHNDHYINLCIDKSIGLWDSNNTILSVCTELTYKQFMNGTVPKKKKEFKVGDWVLPSGSFNYGNPLCPVQLVEIREDGYCYFRHDNGSRVGFWPKQIQHTTKPKEQPLRYKEWDVKVDNCGRTVQIGCQRFTKDELTNALKVMSEAQAHTDLKEFRAWLDNNADKLGI